MGQAQTCPGGLKYAQPVNAGLVAIVAWRTDTTTMVMHGGTRAIYPGSAAL